MDHNFKYIYVFIVDYGTCLKCKLMSIYNLGVGFPCGSVVKDLPAVQETQELWVQSLGGENPLERKLASHSSILDWEIRWTEESGGLYFIGEMNSIQDM